MLFSGLGTLTNAEKVTDQNKLIKTEQKPLKMQ